MNLHWHRTRLVWFCLPGLVFLLWAWWDSGAHYSTISLGDRHYWSVCEVTASEGLLKVTVETDSLKHLKSDGLSWYTDRGPVTLEGLSLNPSHLSGYTQTRGVDFPQPFREVNNMDSPLGPNPAADGWVASPGETLPTPELVSVRWEIALWSLTIGYLVVGTLLVTGWQFRKARLLKLATQAVAMSPP